MTTLTQPNHSAPARAIVQRTRGRSGPIHVLMSPVPTCGEIPEPFVFLDLFDHEGAPSTVPSHAPLGDLHPDNVAEGAVSYIDPDDFRAHCRPARRMDGRRGAYVALRGLDKEAGNRAAFNWGSPCRGRSNWARP